MNTLHLTRPRRLAVAVAGLALATAAVGWLHTPRGMALLRAAGVPCPVTRASAADVLLVRGEGLAALRSARATPTHEAVGFALETTTYAQAQAWAAAHGVACEPVRKGLEYLRCRGFDARALGIAGPPVSEMWLSFRPDGRLLAVDVYRRGLDDGGASAVWSDAARRLRTRLGSPTRTLGDPAPAVLRGSALQTARIEYRCQDYAVTLTAANLPYAGLAVREQYVSAVP